MSFGYADYDGRDRDTHLGIRMDEDGLASKQRFDLLSISVFQLMLAETEISLNSQFHWLVIASFI